ncbi:MAG: helix-turn-helix domain-containing protein [Chloroflexota bacterium]
MARLGDMLRAARQDMGVSLAEVEQATKIRRHYLVALEDEDFTALPESIYVYGFLKTYARHLGLDPEQAVQLFKEQSGRQELPGVQPETRIVREATKRRGGLSPAGASGLLMLAGLVLLLFYGYQQYLNIQGAVQPKPTAPSVTATPPSVAATSTPALAPTPPVPAAATVGPTATATAVRGVAVELRIVGSECWVRAVVDDKLAEQSILKPGEKRSWRGDNYVLLRLGNAAAADVSVNGVPQGILGGPGVVIEKEWRSQATR